MASSTRRWGVRARAGGALVLLVLAASPIACKDCGSSGGSGATAAGSGSAALTATPSSSARRPTLPGSGSYGPIFRLVQGLGLNDEQKASIEKIATELREADKAAREAEGDAGGRPTMKAMQAELVVGIKAGKVDVAKVEAQHAAMEKVAKARHLREAEALTKVQRVLDPAQRSTVVTNMRAGDEKRAARIKSREKPDAGRPDAGSINWAKLRLESYTQDIGLDPEQKQKIQTMLPATSSPDPHEESKAQFDALLTAFGKDGFDAAQFHVDEGKARFVLMLDVVKYVAQVAPILKPEQRDKLADKFEKSTQDPRQHRRGPPRGDVPEPDDELQ